MAKILTTCDGAFVGHVIASQFDPSVFMASNISESLLVCKRFDGPDILSRHLYLYHTTKAEIGETTKYIYQHASNMLKNKQVKSISSHESFLFDQKMIDETARVADEKFNGQTAGCGPAQRSFPLALSSYISDDDLFNVSMKEAKLTHFNPLAGQVAGIVNLIIRSLMRNQDWYDAVDASFNTSGLHADITDVKRRYHRWSTITSCAQTAYAPAALNAALHYVSNASSAGKAIAEAQSVDRHYSAPIVGILAGARWGIPIDLYKNQAHDSQLQTLRATASQLSDIWTAKPAPVQG